MLREREDQKGPYFPLYLNLSFNRRNKSIKSITYELLDSINFRTDLIFDSKSEIEKNDIRILEGYRAFVESQSREFSIDLISPENLEFLKFKMPVFNIGKSIITQKLFLFFNGNGQKSDYRYTMLVMFEVQNWVYFINHFKEISPEKYQKFLEQNPIIEQLINEFEILHTANKFPYLIDFERLNPDFLRLKSLIESV